MIAGGGDIDLILFGAHVGLRFALIERGLRLAQSGTLFEKFLFKLAAIKANNGIAFFDVAAAGREPDDLKICHSNGRGDLIGAAGGQRAATTDKDSEIALTNGRGREVDQRLAARVLFPGEGGAGDEQGGDPEAKPERARGH